MPVVSEDSTRQDLPLFYPLTTSLFPSSISKPKKKHHQTLTEKAFISDKTMQVEKPIKTNPHTNAYKLNTKTQFPSFQNH